jgi:hypothetical protein
MFGRHRHRQGTADVEPDLPITPMLDMSFQLLAFFIMTFQPTKTEGQITVALPKQDGGKDSIPDVVNQTEKPLDITAQVRGSGGKMTSIRVFRGPKEGEAGKELDPISYDVKEGAEREAVRGYMNDLQTRFKANKSVKLHLEIEETVLQAYVVMLFDAGLRAFQMVYGPTAAAEISTFPLDAGKR